MTQTYRAILKNNQVIWLGDRPDLDGATEVSLTIVEPLPEPQQPEPQQPEEHQAEQQQRLLAILTQLAEANPFRAIKNPVAWQREQRQDRPLPFRNS